MPLSNSCALNSVMVGLNNKLFEFEISPNKSQVSLLINIHLFTLSIPVSSIKNDEFSARSYALLVIVPSQIIFLLALYYFPLASDGAFPYNLVVLVSVTLEPAPTDNAPSPSPLNIVDSNQAIAFSSLTADEFHSHVSSSTLFLFDLVTPLNELFEKLIVNPITSKTLPTPYFLTISTNFVSYA
jgi:hypothetical protein